MSADTPCSEADWFCNGERRDVQHIWSLALNTEKWSGYLHRSKFIWSRILREAETLCITMKNTFFNVYFLHTENLSHRDWSSELWRTKLKEDIRTGSVPSFNKLIPSCFPSCEWLGSREDWERLTSAESWSRLWKLFLQVSNIS